jgi:hypothetical protein
MFLIAENAPDLFDPTSRYSFAPYDYGPFDSSVYQDLEQMQRDELVRVDKHEGYGYRCYRATEQGVAIGRTLLDGMPQPRRALVEKTVALVLPLTFRQLVSAIYRTYPHMKVNSVFNG